MNERIRELAFKAANGMLSFDEDGFRLSETEAMRFAQLIVLEVLAVQENLISNGHNAWHLHKPTKKHFGIRE